MAAIPAARLAAARGARAGELQLPNNWQPRPYQVPLWTYLSNGGKRAVAIHHRRAGKDDVSLHHTACGAHERVGNYVHMLPIYAQARKAIWDAVNAHTGKRRIDEAFPDELRSWTREHEMSIGFKNGSSWQLAGSDNYNSLVGTAYAGMVFSEYALSNPSAWGYFSPILMENDGWAVFITTPRGRNHACDMYELAQTEEGWFAEILTNDDTHVFTDEQMEQERRRLVKLHGDDYGTALWRQEYFCSFDAAIPGSIWGDCVERAQQEGRIGDVPVEPGVPVMTAWDLGFTDDTAIWFFQLALGEIRVIDYFEASGKNIPFYCEVLRTRALERGFTYGTHWFPHDARPRTLAAGGKSILDQFEAILKPRRGGDCHIGPRLDREEGIQAARATFPMCWFDATRCKEGIERLRHYHREWDDEKKVFSMIPVHDFSSHAADAFRGLSLTWKYVDAKQPQRGLIDRLRANSVSEHTFGDLKKRFFARKARERADRL